MSCSVSRIAVPLLVMTLGAAPAMAAIGDLLSVTAERVNLRAGPSDAANVRGQLLRGEQLIELRREGGWLGVRHLRTGEEGWIFGELVRRDQGSTLERQARSGGFGELSRDFDRMFGMLGDQLGLDPVSRVEVKNGSDLEVLLDPEWVRAGSAREHLWSALAIYTMWKNHQNNRPVRVVMRSAPDESYITIDDRSSEPAISIGRLGG